MGIHTSIYRIRSITSYTSKTYKIHLTKNNNDIPLTNPCEIREEFYFGKSVFQINYWFYQRLIKRYKNDNDSLSLHYDQIFDEWLYLDDLKALLNNIQKVLGSPSLAAELLPYPDEVLQQTPTPYDNSYFNDLKHAQHLLIKLIEEADDELVDSCYIIDIG